ncbi:hypothetical protein SteCoe_35937 [Stentor coeruleus]|uniref:RING-type domain-containing protein n=1 Tax=Stentor coeruleus TaxID=5963 RepID=A0A1R2ARI0_9CILI|nr:hypothetical protein SteCoe_35937 [Stentor coeruleus]
MLILINLISVCLAKLSIISPDNLTDTTIPYMINTFSNPHLYPAYGILVFLNISSSCKLSQDQKSLLNITTIPVIQGVDLYGCLYSDISYESENSGSPGSIIVSDNAEFYDNFYNKDLVVKENNEYFSLFSFCIIITSETLKIFDDYLDKQIWAIYSYAEIKQTEFPSVKYYMASDFDYDNDFFQNLIYISNLFDIWRNELQFIFTYLDYDSFDYDVADNCYINSDSSAYCLPPSFNSTGIDRVLNSILLLNAYDRFSNSDVYGYISYYLELINKCYYNRSAKCHEEVLMNYGIEPNYDDSVLKGGFLENEIFARASINEVYIYDFYYMSDLYVLSGTADFISSINCDAGCSTMNITNNICEKNCNTEKCAFDSLQCLKEDLCYTFIIGDGNCNSLCNNDTDCYQNIVTNDSDNDDDKTLLIEILVPILGFFLIAGIIVGVIIVCVMKKRKKEEKKEKIENPKVLENLSTSNPQLLASSAKGLEYGIEILANDENLDPLNNNNIGVYTKFRKDLIYTGDAVCRIDIMAIEEGQDVMIFENQCKHIFHANCIKKWSFENNSEECPNCQIERKKSMQFGNKI